MIDRQIDQQTDLLHPSIHPSIYIWNIMPGIANFAIWEKTHSSVLECAELLCSLGNGNKTRNTTPV